MNDGVDKMVSKRKTKKGLIIGFITVLTGIIIAFVALIIRTYYFDVNKYNLKKEDVYQYLNGSKFEYTGSFSITKDNEITKIDSDEIKIDINNYPIYFKNDEYSALFPINMELIVFSDINKSYRVNYFSKITTDKDENTANITYKNNKVVVDKCFMYDGNDLYFFPYPVTLKVEDEEYNLSSLSFVNVSYKNEIEIYNKKLDEDIIIETHDKDVIASIDKYQINLSTDMIISEVGSRLLIKNVSNLPSYIK